MNTPQADTTIYPVQAVDPNSKTTYTFTDVGALHNAIKLYNYIPVHTDGTPFKTQYLQEVDGYVLDGAPINVWMEGVWLTGQKDILQKYWAAGSVPQPPANVMNAGEVPMPAQVQAQTAAYQAMQGGLFGMDTGTLVAVGVGVLAIFWLSSGKKGRRGGDGFTGFDF
jgi:hypothetical protein